MCDEATTERVRLAFERTPRRGFLRRRDRGVAAIDAPIPIGCGATNSQPSTVATMLEELSPRPGDKVLDVGAGSGWTTALLAELVGPSGRVVGVELVPALVRFANSNLARIDRPWASVRAAEPNVLGVPEEAPFDRILVSAMADELPDRLIAQLAPSGVLVAPVDGQMVRATRRPDGGLDEERFGRYTFVPLIGS